MEFQPALFEPDGLHLGPQGNPISEEPAYLTEQLITYIGNKRTLLPQIGMAVDAVRRSVDGRKLRILDAFAGSGVVSRYMKQHAEVLYSNDFETYAKAIADCFLLNRSEVDVEALEGVVCEINDRYTAGHRVRGFFSELYAPRDMHDIRPHERCFYSPDNALRLDTFRAALDGVPANLRVMLLGPLLSEASRHVNTGGVFKGFYKDKLGVGKFGGQGENALQRILAPIKMSAPVLSRYECDVATYQMDANELISQLPELDLIYIDPPYNQHPYGSNYFMLNLLVSNERPEELSKVSGIPTDWQRSAYNKRSEAFAVFRDLTTRARARFLLVSYSDEGFIPPGDMKLHLESLGKVTEIRTPYTAYRASRNLGDRPLKVTEHLYLVERDGVSNG